MAIEVHTADYEPCGKAAMHGAAAMKRIPDEAAAKEGEERKAPNGRLAVMSGELWLGLLNDSGRDREPPVYAGFRVEQDEVGKIISVIKEIEYKKKDAQHKAICKHYRGRLTSATPYQSFTLPMLVEGRNCQLLTL